MATAYEQFVRRKLGEDVAKLLSDNVTNGTINAQNMKDLAFKLVPSEEQKIGGNHVRRTQDGGEASDWAEMRRILCDWYNEELFDIDREAAVQKLVNIFMDPDINLRPLATQLKGILHDITNLLEIIQKSISEIAPDLKEKILKSIQDHEEQQKKKETTPEDVYNRIDREFEMILDPNTPYSLRRLEKKLEK